MKFIKSFLYIIVLFIISSCGNKNKNESVINIVTTDLQKNKIQKLDINTTIGEGIVWRKEEVEDSNTWTEIEITNIFGFKKEVEKGERIQIIPLRKELPIIQLPVINTKKRDDIKSDIWFEIMLEKIPENYQEFWDISALPNIRAEYPSNVLVVYPPIKNCKLLDLSFETKDLPTKISNEIIKGALDFDNDNLPDAIVVEFCCNNKESNTNCEYVCTETYIKINNSWTMINSSKPM